MSNTNNTAIRIGVLALQGSMELHRPHLDAIGAKYVEVTSSLGLQEIDGLILPGGESGVMLKLINVVAMESDLQTFFKSKPVWGICAGAILMAKSVHSPMQRSFAAIDIKIERNSYGRQLDSAEGLVNGYQVAYIRAPRILQVGSNVSVLQRLNNDPTWVESGNLMVTTFHPEINHAAPSPWHMRFVELCSNYRFSTIGVRPWPNTTD